MSSYIVNFTTAPLRAATSAAVRTAATRPSTSLASAGQRSAMSTTSGTAAPGTFSLANKRTRILVATGLFTGGFVDGALYMKYTGNGASGKKQA
ncbi:uncharacterized protein E0L32_001350 [Thyridium curvatum]|uniref:Uncharacterized protein n=1 Tax=Thyridium curvatum TaxID=1093900 RepID=A0A507AQT3_9PEZI|nr:uncharacterized protein E0L32_001350 [Thyridium curvatum]TPX10153.1 hypothetical protein E0L32_001350 [Thyridium curvatum]